MSASDYLPLPRDGGLAKFVMDRGRLDREQRMALAMPRVGNANRLDALLVALHCMAQDSPIFLVTGLLAFVAMGLVLFYRSCSFIGSVL